MEKYRIVTRYEWYSSSGLAWTKWFQDTFSPITDSEDELKPILKECKERTKDIDKRTKRKSEFMIEKFEYIPFDFSNIKNKPRTRKKKTTKKDESNKD